MRRAVALATALLLLVAAVAQPAGAREEAAPLPQAQAAEASGRLARRPDERRPEVQFSTTLFGRPLILGGQYEITHQSRLNFDLDSRVDRDRGRLDQELKAEAFYRATGDTSLFLQLVGLSEIDTHRSTGERTSTDALERGQMWVYADRVLADPLALQAGRIALIEPRTWWWDENLDAVRLYAGRSNWLLETGLARELGRTSTEESHIDPEQERVARWFGRAAYEWRRRHALEAYWLHSEDSSSQPAPGTVLAEDEADPSDARLSWFGLRATGDQRLGKAQRFGYWLDAAWLSGRETVTVFRDIGTDQVSVARLSDQSVRGQAVDVGIMWTLPGAWRPTLTAAYARGSGDGDSGDGVDHAYRQTGLHENKARYRGVNRFRYYGELLRPDLSNLAVSTLAFGFRFLPRSSLELVLHDYRQVHPSRSLPGERLDASPRGVDPSLGSELDLILGVREWERIELAARFARFRAGRAFGERSGEHATLLELSMTLVF
jgi:alginate production protein